jgi:hypothetical protein
MPKNSLTILRNRIKKPSFSANSGLAAGAFCLLALTLAVCPAELSVVRADSAPDWLTAAGRADLGHFGGGSAAVILANRTDFVVDSSGKFVETERVAMRVLNRRSADRYLAAVGEENNETKVISIQTWAISPSGRVTQSGKKDVISAAAKAGFELFADSRVKAIQIPGADDGSLVGYEIVTEGRSLINGQRFNMEEEIPTRLSELHVSIPSGSLHFFLNHPDRVQVISQDGTSAVFRSENRPAIPDEPSSPPFSSLAAFVFVNYDFKGPGALQSWEEAGHEYHALFDNGEKPETDIATQVAALATPKPEVLDKINSLYSYVSRQIRYVAIEIGIGGYQPHQAADVFKYKYGDCKDKANLLISMLNKIGIRAYPALVGTRGDVEADPAAPTLTTFDHMIVALPVSDSLRPAMEHFSSYDPKARILWIDPTSEADPLGQLPEWDQGVYALIAYPDHGDLRRIPEVAPESSGAKYDVHVRLQSDGTGLAEVEVKYLGVRNTERHYFYRNRSQSEILKVYEGRVANFVNDAQFQRASIAGVENSDAQVVENYSFRGDFSSASSGDSWFFQPLFLSGISVPEHGMRPRALPLDIGSPEMIRASYREELPVGTRLDAVPSNASIQSEFGELQVEYALSGNILTVNQTLSYTESIIPPEKYPAYRDFVNACLRAERQRVRIIGAAH